MWAGPLGLPCNPNKNCIAISKKKKIAISKKKKLKWIEGPYQHEKKQSHSQYRG